MGRLEIIALRKEHPEWTLDRIARTLGISRQRVHQVLLDAIYRGEELKVASAHRAEFRRGVAQPRNLEWACSYCGKIFSVRRSYLNQRLRRTKSGRIFCSDCRGKPQVFRSRQITEFLESVQYGAISLLDMDRRFLRRLQRALYRLRRNNQAPGLQIGAWHDKILIWREAKSGGEK